MRIDLHVHTTASDGIFAPARVVRMARQAGVSVIGIADHDTVDGIDEACAAAPEESVTVVPAVEINAYSGDGEYHLLGYYVNHRDEALRRSLAALREARLKRMYLILDKLARIGIRLSDRDVFALSGTGAIGRPHIARAMVHKGFAVSIEDAFDRYIGGEGKPAYAPRSKLTPREAIDIIASSGGLPVLAHPGFWGDDELIPRMAEWGIVGIEVYAGEHSPEQTRRYRDMARSLGLVATGGSDFHGWSGPSRNAIGAVETPPEEYLRLREMASSRRKIN